MHCPKSGDVLKEQHGVFLCERGQMELSPHIAERLYAGFVSKIEQPEDFHFTKPGYHFGGQWFCPGCGVLMNEEEPGGSGVPSADGTLASISSNWSNCTRTTGMV